MARHHWPAVISSLVVGAGLLVAAVHLRDPRLLALRGTATSGVVLFGVAGALVCLWMWRRRGWRGGLVPGLALLWAAGPALAIHGELLFAQQVRAVLGSGAAGQEVGRHFLVGYTDARAVASLAARGLIGGVFVTTRNLEGRSAEALRTEIADLQAIRREAGLPPLFVATDQEGGAVSRLSPPLPTLPPLGALADLPAVGREAAAQARGASEGAGLAAFGVNVNFAPVLDLRVPGLQVGRHLQSPIAERAISDDPRIVGAIGLAYARGLAEAGVTATLKHFPGLGRATADTHVATAPIAATREELEASDLMPFRHVLGGTEAWLMLGHATVMALDPERPASLSARVVTGLLRQEWGFDGIVVTDDMNMAPILAAGLCGAGIAALNAGVDVLLLSWDPDGYYRAMSCVLEARRRGTLDPTLLAESRRRLERAVARPQGH
ncbi:glycoside hydrolase family 3 N-terminal domain-containing protein [Pararoseomonas sp. SCSIO 73927]|uniref:glycoside hydrolase family 3 N-terminal domain-containing protein n=1 Tax=Pararoseomonas sp. SCSIO 73927 TaxID=3114537 RepID=UPI0030CF9EEE